MTGAKVINIPMIIHETANSDDLNSNRSINKLIKNDSNDIK